MLYNPKWDTRPILDQWIDWLETKDPDEKYEWSSIPECACGQYFGEGWQEIQGTSRLNAIARGFKSVTDRADHTFGQCLVRAKQVRDNPWW